MKHILLTGCIIGLLSGLWLLLLYLMGYLTFLTDLVSWFTLAKPPGPALLLAVAVLWIPAAGLYFGLRNYKRIQGGKITFRAALAAGSRIALVAGLLALVSALIYWKTAAHGAMSEFAGMVIAGLVIGLLLVVITALVLKNE
ncbi:DUF4199 family protein [Mucilaginibacter sp. BT774]|uniref:DUF4199 family protein n=1 Tax=Mucilaginibacter sp. BT774 TaxID=3062276 RepID=UPI00267624CB|nr:DUF4199 family protein [Mucilaginibacter sp. BT774]MDO3627629.1 DUF4199 family protein [Mucilaginibacter sp. BT774]